jgi:hypothetical protein
VQVITWPLAVVPRAEGWEHSAPSVTFCAVGPPPEVTGPEFPPAIAEVTGLLVLVVADLSLSLLHAPARAKTRIATQASRY